MIGDHSVVTSSASATQAKSDFTKTLTNLATGALKVTYNGTDVPVQSMTVTDSNGNSQSMYYQKLFHLFTIVLTYNDVVVERM